MDLAFTVSGWDLYESARDSGDDVLLLPGFFTDSSGHSVRFFTGLATLISGLLLAGSTIVVLALGSLLPLFRPRNRAFLAWMLGVLTMLALVVPAGLNAASYFRAGAASGASLEYGLILLWIATFVGLLGLLGMVAASARRALESEEPGALPTTVGTASLPLAQPSAGLAGSRARSRSSARVAPARRRVLPCLVIVWLALLVIFGGFVLFGEL